MKNDQHETTVFYVSTRGDDRWSGRLPEATGPGADGPFATLERARDAVRQLKTAGGLPRGGVSVCLRGGEYRLLRGLVLDAEDSGTAGAPVVYRACEGETVRLVGGCRLAPSAFTPVTDPAIRARLAPAARDHVVQVDLPAQGVTDLGAFSSRGFGRRTVPAHLELFFNDQPMTVAQWPDAGRFAIITGYTKPKLNEWGNESGDLTGGFTYAGDRPRRWAPSDDIWVHGYWAYDWANSYERVRRLDAEARVVETYKPYGNYHFQPGQRFYFLNVLEELDQPGEYYVDRDSGKLYFWPPDSLQGADVLVSVLAEPLVSLKGVSHVEFRGLTLEAGRGNGIEIAGGDSVRIVACTIRNMGNWAVRLNDGTRHSVAGCDIYGTGDGGVRISGGDRTTLTPCDHAVLNCHIHHYARWSRCYVPAVLASGVGVRIAHNLIHDAPHNAVLFAGNDIVIEDNEIYRVCLETGDAGAIYTGRDYTFRGNVVRRNFIHHMGGVGMGSIAIYMDDCVSGTHIAQNILQDCQYGLMLGGGRDFIVENNVFVNCHPAISADARGVDRNPVWQNMVKNIMRERLDKIPYHEPPYSVRYPEIADVDPHYAAGRGVPPENNRVERNICCGGEWISKTWPEGAHNGITEKNNLVGGDPGFTDPEFGVFELRANSPAWASGFKPIRLAEIGLVRDAFRAAIPPHVRAALRLLSDPVADQPARVQLALRNDGTDAASGTVVVDCTGTADAALAGPSRVDFSLAPGETRTWDFTLTAGPGQATVEVASPDAWLHPARLAISFP